MAWKLSKFGRRHINLLIQEDEQPQTECMQKKSRLRHIYQTSAC